MEITFTTIIATAAVVIMALAMAVERIAKAITYFNKK